MNRIMKGWFKGTGIVLLSMNIVAFTGNGSAAADPLNILTTTTDLAAIAGAVAGDHATVKSICSGREDPHFLQARPSYIIMARNADLWIRIGMELEIGWEDPILDGARNRTIRVGGRAHLDASERVRRLGVPSARITRAMGDVHPQGNPHYWLDPLNGRIMAKTIAVRLEQLFPEYSEDFRANLKAFQRKIDVHMFGPALVDAVGGAKLWTLELRGELDGFVTARRLEGRLGGWKARMQPFAGEKIITYHQSWDYFAARFGLQIADQLEPKPGIPPSPGHVLAIIRTVKAQAITTLLMEPFYSPKAPDLIAEKTGIRVVVSANTVGGEPAATDYVSMIGNIVDKLYAAFEAGRKLRGDGK